MKAFVSKHAGEVIGVLSGFDRLVFRGTLRLLAHHLGMQQYLWAMKMLLKDFANHAEAVTRQLREASEAHARSTGRPIHFMPSSASSKEERARTIAQQDGIEQGLICIHLIRKVPHTHRYQLTDAGRIAVTDCSPHDASARSNSRNWPLDQNHRNPRGFLRLLVQSFTECTRGFTEKDLIGALRGGILRQGAGAKRYLLSL